MVRTLMLAAALLATAVSLSACVVEAPLRPGCRVVPAHWGPGGYWHRAHCA